MSTPETNLETVVDTSSDEQARKQALESLEAANECDMLAELVTDENLEEQYRQQALTSLGHPQCRSMLESLVESGDVPEPHRERAEELLEETADDSGAGP